MILNDVRIARGRPGHSTYGYYLAPEDYLRPSRARSAPSSIRPVPAVVDQDVAEEEPEGEQPGTQEVKKIATNPANGGASVMGSRFEPSAVTGDDG